MPIFFIHSRFGNGVVRDMEGEYFADLASACRSARQAGRAIAADEICMGADMVDLELTIDAESGEQVGRIYVTADVMCTEPDEESKAV